MPNFSEYNFSNQRALVRVDFNVPIKDGKIGGGLAEKVEQHAVAVGEHDGIAGAGQLLVQIGHFDLGHGAQVGQANESVGGTRK